MKISADIIKNIEALSSRIKRPPTPLELDIIKKCCDLGMRTKSIYDGRHGIRLGRLNYSQIKYAVEVRFGGVKKCI